MNEPVLTREQIVAAALALLQQGGLAEVSLRKLAARLQVKAPSLYWHVDNKEMLHGLMSRAIFRACLEAIPPCSDWRRWLREFGLSLWRAQQATPDIRQLIVIAPIDVEAREQTHATVIAELVRLGLDVEVSAMAQQSIQALVTGWTTLSIGSAQQKNSSTEWFLQSLDALIDGWTVRATAHRDIVLPQKKAQQQLDRTTR